MDTEKLIEKTTEALERCVMQCMEHDCCLGSAHDTINDDPRAVLRSAFAEVRRMALEEARYSCCNQPIDTLCPTCCGVEGCGEPKGHFGCHGWCGRIDPHAVCRRAVQHDARPTWPTPVQKEPTE